VPSTSLGWRPKCVYCGSYALLNRLKALLRFNLTPIYRGCDLEKWDRETGFPVPPHTEPLD
jgi:hypothetical protein